MTALEKAAELCRAFEDFIPHAYDDADPKARPVKPGQKIKGTLTQGYGTTGKRVKADTIN